MSLLLGGMMAGLGQGITGLAQMGLQDSLEEKRQRAIELRERNLAQFKHRLDQETQGRQFAHAEKLADKQITARQDEQQAGFTHDETMEGVRAGHRKDEQKRGFTHDESMEGVRAANRIKEQEEQFRLQTQLEQDKPRSPYTESERGILNKDTGAFSPHNPDQVPGMRLRGTGSTGSLSPLYNSTTNALVTAMGGKMNDLGQISLPEGQDERFMEANRYAHSLIDRGHNPGMAATAAYFLYQEKLSPEAALKKARQEVESERTLPNRVRGALGIQVTGERAAIEERAQDFSRDPDPGRFKTPEEVKRAYQKGELSLRQAEEILRTF